jgi:hypothetical protein
LTSRDSLNDGDIADNLEVHTGIVPSRMGLPGSGITFTPTGAGPADIA